MSFKSKIPYSIKSEIGDCLKFYLRAPVYIFYNSTPMTKGQAETCPLFFFVAEATDELLKGMSAFAVYDQACCGT